MNDSAEPSRSPSRAILWSSLGVAVAILILAYNVSELRLHTQVHTSKIDFPNNLNRRPPPVFSYADKERIAEQFRERIRRYHSEHDGEPVTFSDGVTSYTFTPSTRLYIDAKLGDEEVTYWCDFRFTPFGELKYDVRMYVYAKQGSQKYSSAGDIIEDELMHVELSEYAQEARMRRW